MLSFTITTAILATLLYYYTTNLKLILVLVALALLFYYFAVKPMSYWSEKGIKQAPPIWLLGNNFRSTFKLESFGDMVRSVYEAVPGTRYSGMYQFTLPTLLIRDPELIKQICVKDFEHFLDHRSFLNEKSEPLLSRSLFLLKGQQWRDTRPLISPTFTSSKMKSMFVLMSECAENLTKHFLKKDQDSIELEMKDTFTRYTNDVIATTAFGIKVDSLEKPNNEFYLMGKDATDFSGFWRGLKFLGFFLFPKILEIFKIGFFSKYVYEFFTNVIDTTIKTREEKGIVRPDMINVLMEARKGIQHKEEKVIDTGFAVVEDIDLGKGNAKDISNLDIAAHAMGFFFAGFDAVSSLMGFMSYELAINSDIQERLREEIRKTLHECKGNLTYEALLKMKYMDMVVSETLRKWPNAVAADRVCTKPYTIEPATPDEKPLLLETGTTLWIPIMGIHYDPQYYPNPERFDPERFSDENKDKINPYAYIPFGVGPRNCIGSRFALLETKVLFFQLLSNFEFVPTAKTKIPLRLSTKQFNPTAEGGFYFAFKRLKQ